MDDVAIHVSFERRSDIPFEEYVRTDYKRSWFSRSQRNDVYRKLSRPALIVTTTPSETARHWMLKLNLYKHEILPPVVHHVWENGKQRPQTKYHPHTLGMLVINNPRTIHRDDAGQLNHAQDLIVKKLKEIKAIIESHSIETPSSYDI